MYLLDTSIVAAFQQAGALDRLVEIANGVPVALVEDVYDELTRHVRGKSGEISKEIREKLHPAVQVLGIDAEAPSWRTFEQLRATRRSTDDLGEHASIALASHDLRLVFVAHDRRAVFEAVEAIALRVLTLHPFLRSVVERGAIERQAARQIASGILAAKAARGQPWPPPPTWWTPWAQGE